MTPSHPKSEHTEGFTYADLMPVPGDVMILVRDGGLRGRARIRIGDDILTMPMDVRVEYFADDDHPPLTPRRVTVKAGWLARRKRPNAS
jgi:hypothetical protein